ncbi:hypothetical protein, partial [Frankia sp. Cppng1_Ct_nod]|uniref:hypothetical protein n=1 Tax=Frankia sp. Cppng1_Ct_nod TaxID=2897162 RepID=UPI002025384B
MGHRPARRLGRQAHARAVRVRPARAARAPVVPVVGRRRARCPHALVARVVGRGRARCPHVLVVPVDPAPTRVCSRPVPPVAGHGPALVVLVDRLPA